MEGNLRLNIVWSSLIVGSKFTVFALFYFVSEGNFPSTSPRGASICRGYLTEDFFALRVWGTYIWRGDLTEGFFALLVWGAYFRNFTVAKLQWHGLPGRGLKAKLRVNLATVRSNRV